MPSRLPSVAIALSESTARKRCWHTLTQRRNGCRWISVLSSCSATCAPSIFSVPFDAALDDVRRARLSNRERRRARCAANGAAASRSRRFVRIRRVVRSGGAASASVRTNQGACIPAIKRCCERHRGRSTSIATPATWVITSGSSPPTGCSASRKKRTRCAISSRRNSSYFWKLPGLISCSWLPSTIRRLPPSEQDWNVLCVAKAVER